jgi:hypothetical protein
MTHPGSGWQTVFSELNLNPRIEIFTTDNDYNHPDDVNQLTKEIHKSSNSSSIWGDVILHNHKFTCQNYFKHSYFIFWYSEFDPKHAEWKAYTNAYPYYRLRTAGMIQYFHKATKSLWNPAPGDLLTFFN